MAIACGDDDDDDGDDATLSPTAEATEVPTEAPTNAPSAYPVEVTDLLGRDVVITAKPEAVVALSPTAAEFVFAAGGSLVGRASSVVYPEQALEADEVGTAYQPNFEAILALNPDLIVADSVIHVAPDFRDPLVSLGVPVIFAGADSYQGVLDGLALMGETFADSDKTNAMIAAIEEALAETRSQINGQDVSALVFIADRDQVLYAAKGGSYAGDLLDRLGIENPAAGEPDSGPFPGFTALSPEVILRFDPDVIITVSAAPPPAPKLSEVFVQIPPFQGLTAIQNDKVVEVDVALLVQAPGPRIIEAMRALAEAAVGP